MGNNIMEKVSILYKNVDGLHFFLAGDAQTAGLCAFARDLDLAISYVSEQLSIIFKYNYGKNVDFGMPEAVVNLIKNAVNRLNQAGFEPDYTKIIEGLQLGLTSSDVDGSSELIAA